MQHAQKYTIDISCSNTLQRGNRWIMDFNLKVIVQLGHTSWIRNDSARAVTLNSNTVYSQEIMPITPDFRIYTQTELPGWSGFSLAKVKVMRKGQSLRHLFFRESFLWYFSKYTVFYALFATHIKYVVWFNSDIFYGGRAHVFSCVFAKFTQQHCLTPKILRNQSFQFLGNRWFREH